MRSCLIHQISLFPVAVTLAAFSTLGACAGDPLRDSLQALAARDLQPAQAQQRRLSRLTRSENLHVANFQEDLQLKGDVSPERLVALALARNTAIRAAEQRVARLQERIAQATSLDDPRVTVTPIGEMAETAAGQVQVMTSVSQKLPFPGKLATRGAIAARDVAIAKHELENTRLQVAADARRAYWRLYAAVRGKEITTRSRSLVTQALQAAQARYRAGVATQDVVLRASVELRNLDNDLVTLAQQRDSAVAMLNSLLDRPAQAQIPDPAPATVGMEDEELTALLDAARTNNPAVQAALERVEQFRERRALASLNRKPDLTLSAAFNAVSADGLSRVANGDNQWWIGFSINLPIWLDRLAAGEREATRGALEAAGEAANERRRIEFRVTDAYARAKSMRDQAILLRDQIVPDAQQAVASSLAGYRAGTVPFLTMIDNWRRQLTFELMYENAVADLQRALADLREAVAQPEATTNANVNMENTK